MPLQLLGLAATRPPWCSAGRAALHDWPEAWPARALLCGFLQAETRKGCTVGSVLQRLLRKAEFGSVATDLRLAPERCSPTFGVSRIVYGEAESQTEAVEGGEEPVVPAPTRRARHGASGGSTTLHKKVVRADCMQVRMRGERSRRSTRRRSSRTVWTTEGPPAG